MDRIEIIEVGPRDGLQILSQFVPTAQKIELVRKLALAGCPRIEIGSFVSPAAVPQMRDTGMVASAFASDHNFRKMALVPNEKGVRLALDSGVTELIFVISMSDAHNMSNVRRPTQESIEDLKRTLDAVEGASALKIRIGLGTSLHCPFAGLIDEDAVLENVRRILKVRENLEFAVADTTGMAQPLHVRSLCGRLLREFGGSASFGFHGHDTSGFAIANVLAAIDAGIRIFDGSVAGLGGCPFAPGATGNVATEDLVHLCDAMGVETGVSLELLLDAADYAADLPGAEPASHARALPRDRLRGAVPDRGLRATA